MKKLFGFFLIFSITQALANENQSNFKICNKSLSRIQAGLLMGILGPIAYGTATTISFLNWKQYKTEAESGTKKFVRNTLLEAGYDKSRIDNIIIYKGGSFKSIENTIVVPINDKSLKEAQAYHEKKDKSVTGDDLSLWRGLIIHEMAHLQHSHAFQKHLLALVASISASALIGTWPNVHSGPFDEQSDLFAPAFGLGIGVPILVSYFWGPLWRYQERQADKEIIRRINDIEVLEALQNYFESRSKLRVSLIDKIQDLFNDHPRDIERAHLFASAVQQSRNSNTCSS